MSKQKLDDPGVLDVNEARARLGLGPIAQSTPPVKVSPVAVGPLNYKPSSNNENPSLAERIRTMPPPEPWWDWRKNRMVSPLESTTYTPAQPPAYLYVIVSDAGLVKVGFSQDVKKRLAGLQGATAHRLHVHTQEPIDEQLPREAEAEAHKRLSRYRVRGEWFNCHPEVALAAIRRVAMLDD